MKIVVVSGYFNPIHSGHIDLISSAKDMGDYLIVILNSDYQVKLKGSFPFMDEDERLKIVSNLKGVNEVVVSIDRDKSVCGTLRMIRNTYPNDEMVFANGGDRNKDNIPEEGIEGIKFVYGVGGDKTQSSSELIKKCRRRR